MEKRKSLYTTYILHCADHSYYVGKTIDITKRIRQHNGEITGGAKYTRNRRPVRIVYTETFPTNQEACLREYRLKTLTRKQKQALCAPSRR